MTSQPTDAARVYAIIDAEAARDPVGLARRSVAAGCSFLQLRAKQLDDRAFVALANALREICAGAKTAFVVNDRADIARIVRADGLHLGQDDLRVPDARLVVGDMHIGVSTHGPSQARAAERDGADLIAFGPVFETRTKQNPDPVVGVRRLADVCRDLARPVVAIGGITPENAGETLRAGAAYVAAISALPRFVGGE